MQREECMKKQRFGRNQSTRTRRRRARANVVSHKDAHANMPLPHGWGFANQRARAHGAHAPTLVLGPLSGKTLGAIFELPKPKSNLFLSVFHAELKSKQKGEQLFVALASCRLVSRERSSLFSLELGQVNFHLRSRFNYMFLSCFFYDFLFLLLGSLSFHVNFPFMLSFVMMNS